MNSPYLSTTKEYQRFRYSMKIFDDYYKSIEYAECNDFAQRKLILNNPRKKRDYPIFHNTFIYNIHDKDGIIKEDSFYIYYKDKIWSKNHNIYLKTQIDKNNIKSVKLRDLSIKNDIKYTKYKLDK
tara:strand:+ start:2250 stop:2627 length:378 start_codon:yes stop_codon:yes gene_type:complete